MNLQQQLNDAKVQGGNSSPDLPNVVDPKSDNSCSTNVESQRKSFAQIVAQTESMKSQVAQIAETVTIQQRVLEINDRKRRNKNIVIIGMAEESESGSIETSVMDLFKSRLNLKDVKFQSAKRIGKMSRQRKSPCPVLVTFESIEDKRKVLYSKSKLAGSKIFISNDLTKDQQNTERELRKKKQFLISHPQYKDKKRVTIYKGKLWVDRKPVTDENLASAGYTQ